MIEIYNGEYVKINIDAPSNVDGYINFVLNLKFYNFSGGHNFCVSADNFKNIIVQLDNAYNDMDVGIKLSDYDSESFICFKILNGGRVLIYGQLGSEQEDNLWQFKQEVDQTIIKLLITAFNKIARMSE